MSLGVSTRRAVVKRGLMLAGAAAGVQALRVPGVAAQTPAEPLRKTGWITDGTRIPAKGSGDRDWNEVLWTTLMPVHNKDLAAPPLDRWYLWHSTHDGTREGTLLFLYTAPTARGPFTPHPAGAVRIIGGDALRGLCTVAAPPAYKRAGLDRPYDVQFAVDHFQAPDIVWDPETRYFYATPHSIRIDRCSLLNPCGTRQSDLRGPYQATFLMRSRDGLSWELAPTATQSAYGDPLPGLMAYPGSRGFQDYAGTRSSNPAPAFDEVHLDYGRFLRDYDGNLVRIDGEVIWYYRGGATAHAYPWAVGAMSSTDLMTWRKSPGNGARLFRTAARTDDKTQLTLGSALLVDDRVYIVQSAYDLTTPVPVWRIYVKEATRLASEGGAYAWSDGSPGTALYTHPSSGTEGGSYVVEGGNHLLAFGSLLGIYGDPSSAQSVEGALSVA